MFFDDGIPFTQIHLLAKKVKGKSDEGTYGGPIN
jgi:hypothetical protein